VALDDARDEWAIDRVPVYVNKKSRVGHLDRDCDYLSMVPDGAIYLEHRSTSEPIRRRMCPNCSPTYLRPALEQHPAGLTADLQAEPVLSTAEGRGA